MKRALLLGAALASLGTSTGVEARHCTWRHPGHCVRDAGTVVIVVATLPATVVVDVASGVPVGTTAGNIAEAGMTAADDVVKETNRAGENLAEAGRAIGAYTEARANGYIEIASAAERRLREGKIADAFWHLAVSPIDDAKNQEAAAAAAVQESTILNVVAQSAATAYGGPGGAAAYASWYTYRATNGNIEAALKAGALAGATAQGMAAVGTMPADALGQKAIAAGSIGGLAVAAAGGDENDILHGFIAAGGMVLVRDGFQRTTNTELDMKGSPTNIRSN